MAERLGYISGHTGKMLYVSEQEARHVCRNNKYSVRMKIYMCSIGDFVHYHTSTMTKSRYKKFIKGKRLEPKKNYEKRNRTL